MDTVLFFFAITLDSITLGFFLFSHCSLLSFCTLTYQETIRDRLNFYSEEKDRSFGFSFYAILSFSFF